MSDPTPLDALKASRLAPDLTDEQLRTLAALIAYKKLAEGEVLVREGTSDNHLYLLVHGTLPYGHMPGDVFHGDVYPLLSYAVYAPLALVYVIWALVSPKGQGAGGYQSQSPWQVVRFVTIGVGSAFFAGAP